MTERGLESFSISGTNMMFSENAKHIFSRARCLGLSADCAESRDKARILVTAGKGVVQPSSLRIGSPCAIGLPCGPVLVNKTPVAFSLIQSRLDGQWHLAPQRGSGASRTIEVRQGRIELPAGALAPGVTYRYSLRDAAGTEIVAGEFEVLSARMQSDVEVELTRIKSFPDGANLFDILDVLLNNDLWWDAMVRMR